MLRIIFGYRVYDPGDLFGRSGLSGVYACTVSEESKNFASSAERT